MIYSSEQCRRKIGLPYKSSRFCSQVFEEKMTTQSDQRLRAASAVKCLKNETIESVQRLRAASAVS